MSFDSIESKCDNCCVGALSGADFFFRSSSRSQLGTGGWQIIAQESFHDKNKKDMKGNARQENVVREVYFF
jgi:hypothetical protein